ncbi:MAG TPA: hypothetical protein VJ828_03430 [Lacipirellulaceae bacterium]|nr:hypothetical protein [Lacipirellulaceae bacterium]
MRTFEWRADGTARDRDMHLIFAPPKFFSFSRGAKLGQFRPTRLLQVVCWLQVREWWWGETTGVSPRGWDKTGLRWGEIRQACALVLGCHWLRQCQTDLQGIEAIGLSKHQLVLELKMLERRAEATIRKALASKSTGRASGTRRRSER